jgi:hypothetical protein
MRFSIKEFSPMAPLDIQEIADAHLHEALLKKEAARLGRGDNTVNSHVFWLLRRSFAK